MNRYARAFKDFTRDDNDMTNTDIAINKNDATWGVCVSLPKHDALTCDCIRCKLRKAKKEKENDN